ncbi:MAG TPA: hypothetical protein VMV38_01225 [Candidatus Paceibacterota bacterium]|nr:hypothetical protein [Candidatus Paceibacterota bacterium]
MTKQDPSTALCGPQAAIAAMEQESLLRYVVGDGNDPAQFISRLEDQEAEEEVVETPVTVTLGKRVRIIGLPRPNDPPEKRKLWLGMEFSVIEPPPALRHVLSDTHLLVSFDEVLTLFYAKGEGVYAMFLLEMRKISKRKSVPGLLISKAVCKFL